MFYGHVDKSRDRSASDKATEALEGYRRRFPDAPPDTILTSFHDAWMLELEGRMGTLTIRGVSFISSSSFYVGKSDPKTGQGTA